MTPRRRIIPIFVPHAGCPNACVFCNQKRISGSLFPASGQTVEDALCGLPDGSGYELAFYGGSFTAIPAAKQEELLKAAQPAFARGAVSALRVSTRPDAVDPRTLERLHRCHVQTVELGAQSMDNRVLACAGRGHTAEQTRQAAGLIKASGFQLILQMMTGLPGSDEESDIATAREIVKLRPDGVRIYPTVVVKDTPLEEMWRAGQYREHTVEDAVGLCARILPMFETAGIPVIRLGLNPTQELSGGAAVAGAYHPALGELVRSRILRSRAEELLSETPHGKEVRFYAPPRLLSAAIGQHRDNLTYLQRKLGLVRIEVFPEEGEELRLADAAEK